MSLFLFFLDASWFLDHVLIKNNSEEYLFKCNKWIAEDEKYEGAELSVTLTPHIDQNEGLFINIFFI